MSYFIETITQVKDIIGEICKYLDDTSFRHLTMTCKQMSIYKNVKMLTNYYQPSALMSSYVIQNINIPTSGETKFILNYCCDKYHAIKSVNIDIDSKYHVDYDIMFPNNLQSVIVNISDECASGFLTNSQLWRKKIDKMQQRLWNHKAISYVVKIDNITKKTGMFSDVYADVNNAIKMYFGYQIRGPVGMTGCQGMTGIQGAPGPRGH